MASVGIRELRQNASEVVRRVEDGEEIDVTVNGRLAARLVPARPRAQRVQPLSAVEFLKKLAEIPADTTGWAEEIYASRDDDPLFDPWAEQ
ncbi:type II toxin-antitoxin system prevent-host-death family antitoxin [Gryllotalpicola koreensis]